MGFKGIGVKIRRVRKRLGWTQEQLALECDLDASCISHIETGERPNPRLRTVVLIAQALGVRLEELL